MKPSLRRKSLCLLITCCLLSAGALRAQAPVSADSLFKQAQRMAFAGKYAEGRRLSRQLLQVSPHYTDGAILLASTFIWEQAFDSARAVLRPLLEQNPDFAEGLLLMADVELKAGFPEAALPFINRGLALNPAARDFLQRKERANQALGRVEEEAQPGQGGAAQAALLPVNKEALTDRLRLDYQLTTFSKGFSPWHLGAVEYLHQHGRSKYLARINYAERYDQQSLQGELEAYPQLRRNTYAYLSVGASDRKLFPHYRLGVELYHLFPHKIEASLGGRGLFSPDERVILYTAYIGKYFPKYWVSLRPFAHRVGESWQATGILQLRRYLRHEDEHLTLMLAKGSIPFVQVGFREIGRFNATRAGLEGQFRLGKRYLIGGMAAYEYEEYSQDQFRNRFTVGLSLQVKL